MTGAREERIRAWKARTAEVACRLFLEHGFDNVTVEDVCRDAEISHATFYRYFPAKEDVLFSYEEDFQDAVRHAVRHHDTLREIVLAFADYLARRDEFVRLTDAVVAATPALLPRTLLVQRRWRDALAEELAAKEGRRAAGLADTVAAGVALAALSAAMRSWDDDTPKTLRRLVRQALDVAGVT